MLLSMNYIVVPKEWEHKPSIQNKYGYTVALYLAERGIYIDDTWKHDPLIKNKEGKIIFEVYIDRDMEPPEWTYPDKLWRNKDGETPAILLSSICAKIPKSLYHDPSIADN